MMLRLTITSMMLALCAVVTVRGDGHERATDILEVKLAMEDVYVGEIPLNKDRLVEVMIKNTDVRMQEIRQIKLLDEVNGVFRLRDQFQPFGLQAGATHTVRVIVNIKQPGMYRTRLMVGLDANVPPEDTISAMIVAFAVPPPDRIPPLRFALGSVEATVGDTVSIPLICLQGGPWLRERELKEVICDLRYRRSVLTCNFNDSLAVVDEDMRTVRVSLAPYHPTTRGNPDTILAIPMTACLGDAEVSAMQVSRIILVLDTQEVKVDTVVWSTVTIADAWPGDGPRSVHRDPEAPMLRAYPNPTVDEVTLSIHALTKNADIRIYAVDGTEVFAWTSDLEADHIDLHVELNGALAPGIYFCTYISNDYTAHSSFVVLP